MLYEAVLKTKFKRKMALGCPERAIALFWLNLLPNLESVCRSQLLAFQSPAPRARPNLRGQLEFT